MPQEVEKDRSMLQHGDGLSGVRLDPYAGDCSTILSELQVELETKFSPKKEHSEVLASAYARLDHPARASRVQSCGSFLEFAVTPSTKKLQKANFCKDRLCPTCNWRRSLKIFSQVSSIMDYLQNENYRFLFLTLTVKNCSAVDLKATVTELLEGWRKMYHKTPEFKRLVCGSFRSLEITRNSRTSMFHPHLHVILAVKPEYFKGKNYVSQRGWQDIWKRCCNLDYDPIIDIRTIKDSGKGIGGAVAEVSKYAVKDADYLRGSSSTIDSTVANLLYAMSNRRLCGFTGCFLKAQQALKLGDPEGGDLVHINGTIRDDVAYMIVRYSWRCGHYVLCDRSFNG